MDLVSHICAVPTGVNKYGLMIRFSSALPLETYPTLPLHPICGSPLHKLTPPRPFTFIQNQNLEGRGNGQDSVQHAMQLRRGVIALAGTGQECFKRASRRSRQQPSLNRRSIPGPRASSSISSSTSNMSPTTNDGNKATDAPRPHAWIGSAGAAGHDLRSRLHPLSNSTSGRRATDGVQVIP